MDKRLVETFVELIRRCSTDLPEDIEKALKRARGKEKAGSAARGALETLLENTALAREKSAPICQDTGTNIWYVHYPREIDEKDIEKAVISATKKATKAAYLRPNAVDPVTGRNSGDNTGIMAPVIHFSQWKRKSIQADLLLKGGGSENVSCQYSLPYNALSAGRDMDGVRKVVLDGIFQAQGKGCAPGLIGVGIGGDRMTSMQLAKEQLYRHVDDANPDRDLAGLEKTLFRQANSLGIGPMGFEGQTTVIGVKAGKAHRLPASYFVSIAYGCWALRRASVRVSSKSLKFGQLAVNAEKYLRK